MNKRLEGCSGSHEINGTSGWFFCLTDQHEHVKLHILLKLFNNFDG